MAAKFFTGLPMDGPDPECVCGPSAELEQCEDHGDAWTYRHHPLTQRDRLEDA